MFLNLSHASCKVSPSNSQGGGSYSNQWQGGLSYVQTGSSGSSVTQGQGTYYGASCILFSNAAAKRAGQIKKPAQLIDSGCLD